MQRQRRQGGFTLIELLVVIATIAVLIDLLLPDVTSVRDAALAQKIRNRITQTLCDPPFCGPAASVAIRYPAMPGSLTANDVLGSGIAIAYDEAGLPTGNAFVVLPPDALGPNVYAVAFPSSLANILGGNDYKITGGTYVGSTSYLTIEEEGNPVPITLAASYDGRSVEIAQSDAVPEPATVVPLAGSLLAFLWLRRRRARAAVLPRR